MNNKDGLPIHKAHDRVRATVEKKVGHTPAKVNLREALNLSLSKRAYIEDMVPDVIPGFKEYNSFEQKSILIYVLLSDILRRKLWDEIKEKTKEIMMSPDVEQLEQKNLGWKKTIDELHNNIVEPQARQFFKEWAQRMRTSESDEMYKQRFSELDDIIKREGNATPLDTSEKLFNGGYNTGIGFPLGMLKYMPELLRDKGIEPTKEKIVEYFKKNMITTSSAYAAQDLYSFGMINNTINTNFSQFEVEKKVADFSSDYFMLNESGKIVMKEGAFEKIHSWIDRNIEGSELDAHVKINRLVNDEEGKPQLPDGKAKYTWKGCPALFANLITDYESFFKPVLERVLKTQKEYK